MGKVLFDRLAQVSGPVVGSGKEEHYHPVWPVLSVKELGPLTGIIDYHYLAPASKQLHSLDNASILHLRGHETPNIPVTQELLKKLIRYAELGIPIILVGSGAFGHVVEDFVKQAHDKGAKDKVVGIALNSASSTPNHDVLYVRNVDDIPSAIGRKPEHNYIEYYV